MAPRARNVWLIVLVAFIDGCTASAMFTPVKEKSERLQFNGFSIQPPQGSDWYQKVAQDDPPAVAFFHKMSHVITPNFVIGLFVGALMEIGC